MISGPVMIAPVFDVDGDDHDDDALLGQHPPVAQHAVADVADDAVDVEVAGRHLPALAHAVVVEHELVAVLADEHVVGAPRPSARPAGRG